MQNTMTEEHVIATLCRLAAEQVAANPAEVSLDTDLFADLNFDSLNAVEYVMTIEDEFGVNIPDEIAQGVKTVQQAFDALTTIQNAQI